MPIKGSNPFEEIEEMLERMGREFDGDPLGVARSTPVDVADRGDAFVVTADLPGFETEDVEVTLADSTLRIDAERSTSAETEDAEYVRRERRRESVSRSVRLPEAVDEEGVEATYTNGVLTVTLEKQSADGGTQIDIE